MASENDHNIYLSQKWSTLSNPYFFSYIYFALKHLQLAFPSSVSYIQQSHTEG